jgi:hypothetical protein
MPLAPGTKLGPYEITAALGAGGMGEVYRAKDTRLGRDVAIKILPKEMSAEPARKQRFEREARTISGLNHPNICTLHDVGSHDGLDYLVMECVEGETLAARLQKAPLPLEHVMRYGAHLRRVWVGNELVPRMKTDGSHAPVPLGDLLADALKSWHRNTLYAKPDDWRGFLARGQCSRSRLSVTRERTGQWARP